MNKRAEKKIGKATGKHRLLKAVLAVAVVAVAVVAVLNLIVVLTTQQRILTTEEAADLNADCVLVLGCSVRPDGQLSAMLEDRVLTGIDLFDNGAGKKLLMSGDHGQAEYDEVNHMKDYATQKGVDEKYILMDHAGFSTYESMFRAREVFKVKKLIISTQGFHLNRAIYNARRLGLDAYGVKADRRGYATIIYSRLREIAARCKDFIWCIYKPAPTYLGDAIPINSSWGSDTDDREKSTAPVEAFVTAKTEYVTEKTGKSESKPKTPPSLVSQGKSWDKNEKLLEGIPELKAQGITVRKLKTEQGEQLVIRVDKMKYKDYLKYLDKLEKAGFADKNNRANAPKDEPDTVAMYYYAFDGKRTVIAYRNGVNSHAAFDYEMIISNYNMVPEA